MEMLNNYSGLISLIAAIAAIGAVIVPVIIYRKQRKYEAAKDELARKEMAKREREEAQAELDAMGVTDAPISLYGYSKMEIARAKYLWKKAGRR